MILPKNELKIKSKKILENPEIGKPMRYIRKGTKELYIGSFRLSYAYLKDENKIIFLDLYHKDEQ
jgi:mRNA-degrading endonuclease RelE of RelBE toxin-antitoxin system